jgi:zinc resistance-associated protein
MWKPILAGSAALVVLCHSMAIAQQPVRDAAGDVAHRWRPSAEDISAFTDARVAALRAGLKLSPAQEKNWPPFEQAYRDMAKLRAERMKARMDERASRADSQQQTDRGNPIERLQKRADAMTARGAALKHLADAAGPLYQSLDDSQKHRFVILSKLGHHHHIAFQRMRRDQAHDESNRQQ